MQDHHKYYRSQYYLNGSQWWFNLDDGSTNATFHKKLSRNEIFSDVSQLPCILPRPSRPLHNIKCIGVRGRGAAAPPV